MNEVTTIERDARAVERTSSADPVEFMARLASDDRITEEKLRAIWDVQKDMLAERRKEQAESARVSYVAARAKMQKELPIIGRDRKNDHANYKYATLEHIWQECLPVWTKYGFSIGFQSKSVENGLIRVSLHLYHEDGHVEEFQAPDTPPDNVGTGGKVTKTAVQANQSTVTYVKRGLLCSALGIVTRNEDDDGTSVGGYTDRRSERDSRNSGPMREYVNSDDFNRQRAQKTIYPTQHEQKPPPAPEVPQYTTPADTWIGKAERKIVNAGETPKQVDAVGFVMAKAGDLETIEAIKSLPIVQKLAETPDNQTRIRTFEATARKRLSQTEKPIEPQQTPTTGGFVASVDDPDTGEALSGPFMDEIEWAESFLGYWESLAPKEAKDFMRHHAKTILVARRNPEAAKLLIRIKALEG